MKHRGFATWMILGGMTVALVVLASGCRPKFPLCRDSDDCKAEENNATMMVCVDGQCKECAVDADCPTDRPKCKENRCVECIQDGDCPEDKPYCEAERCVVECETEADCTRRGKAGMICEANKCKWECESDTDCTPDKECKDHRCVIRCACQTNEDCTGGLVCEDCNCIERACELQTIYFDFNRYDIRTGDRSSLDANAECMRQRTDAMVTIEGHCDERGTEEYNISLGDKRARAAMKYLKNLGVAAGRMKSISYGEGRPACNQANEDCWSQNRRAQFAE